MDRSGGGKELIGIHVGENIQNILCEKKMFILLKGKNMNICLDVCVCTTCWP